MTEPNSAIPGPTQAAGGFVLDERTLRILEHRRRLRWIGRRGWLVRRVLLLGDVVGLCVAFAVSQAVGRDASPGVASGVSGVETLLFLTTLPIWIVLAKLYDLYDRDEERTDHSTVDDLSGVFHLVTIGGGAFFGGLTLLGLTSPTATEFALFWGTGIVALLVGRGAARLICRRTISYVQNAVIVGADDVGQLAARKLLRHPEYGINVVGFVDAQPRGLHGDIEHLAVVGTPAELLDVIRMFDVERVIIAFSHYSNAETLDLVRSLKDLDVQVDVIPRLFELVSSNARIHTAEGLPLVSLPPLRLSPSSYLLKRAMDLVIATVALVVLAPVLLLVALAILVTSGRPVIFRQTRMGALGKTFEIVKFRTMIQGADARRGELAHLNKHRQNGGDARMFKAKDDPRVTRIGKVLRRYSLDEIPQLWNVVKGEMSLVGPRPLPLEEDAHVDSWARRRLDLRPGITGPWQVLGRSEIPFEEMVKLDYLYVTGWSLGYDLKLLARTIPVLFSVRGAY